MQAGRRGDANRPIGLQTARLPRGRGVVVGVGEDVVASLGRGVVHAADDAALICVRADEAGREGGRDIAVL